MQHHGDKELHDLRVAFLGKKGTLNDLLKGLKYMTNEMKPIFVKKVNEVRYVM
ncbi:phenylalanine--tRNA ligase subunit alpha, partial [Streptococcus suis]